MTRLAQRFHHYFALAIILLAVEACGCSSTVPARHAASGANLTIAFAVQVMNDACTEIADAKYKGGDPEGAFTLARKCAAAYDVAEAAALAAAKVIDAWPTDRDAAVCAVGEEVEALKAIGGYLQAEGVKMPPAYENAMDAAKWMLGMGGSCKR